MGGLKSFGIGLLACSAMVDASRMIAEDSEDWVLEPLSGENGAPKALHDEWARRGLLAETATRKHRPSKEKASRDFTDKALYAYAAPVKAMHYRSLSVIGDSYSSGDGSFGGWGETKCRRNQGSYGVRLNKTIAPGSFQFLPCSGAPVPKIIEQVKSAEYGTPDLVLMTAGGDNGGSFFHILMGCLLFPSKKKCDKAILNANKVADELPASLAPLYEAINSRPVHSDKDRHVFHLGYVQMFNRDADKAQCPAKHGFGSDVTWPSTGAGGYRDKVNKFVLKLNSKIAETARQYNVTYLDPDSLYGGHRFCDGPDQSWMQHKVIFKEDGVIAHPTWDGHGLYMKTVLNYLIAHPPRA